MALWSDLISKRVFRVFVSSTRNMKILSILFSSKKKTNKLMGQTLPRKLLSLTVHGLYLLPDHDNVFFFLIEYIESTVMRIKFAKRRFCFLQYLTSFQNFHNSHARS